MKTFKIALAAMALFAVSLPIQARVAPPGDISLYTKAVEAKKVMVQITNLAEHPASLTLQSAFGDVYFQQTIRNHNGYRTLLDLSKLPEGRYILSIKQKGETKSQVLRITENRLLTSTVKEVN